MMPCLHKRDKADFDHLSREYPIHETMTMRGKKCLVIVANFHWYNHIINLPLMNKGKKGGGAGIH